MCAIFTVLVLRLLFFFFFFFFFLFVNILGLAMSRRSLWEGVTSVLVCCSLYVYSILLSGEVWRCVYEIRAPFGYRVVCGGEKM